MRARSKAREAALHLLYRIEISREDYNQAFKSYCQEHDLPADIADFSFILIDGVLKNIKSIDSLIKKYVKNWVIERMAVIDRNILRISCFELLFYEDIPPKVSINEAIELAKRFGDIDSPRFVNGMLDKIYRSECKVPSRSKDPSSCDAETGLDVPVSGNSGSEHHKKQENP
ncbi:MAG: transcription antitermination factor NusB [Candidatus Omnitrophota bacterium]